MYIKATQVLMSTTARVYVLYMNQEKGQMMEK